MQYSVFERLSEIRSQILPKDTVSGRFARGAFWSMVGTGIAQALTMFSSIFAARWLGVIAFGELGIIRNTALTFGIFAGLGLGLTATKYVAEYRETDTNRAGIIIGLTFQIALFTTLLISMIVFIGAPFLAENLLNAPHLIFELRLGAILILINAMNGMFIGALSGLEAFKSITRVSILQGLLSFPMILAGIWYFGIAGALAGLILSAFCGLLLFTYSLLRECRIHGIPVRFRNVKKEISIILAFSIPALLSQALLGPVVLLTNAILARQPDGYSEVGLLSSVFQWRTLVLFLPAIFVKVALPMMSSSTNKSGSRSNYSDTLIFTHSLTIIVIFPLAILLMFASEWVMSLYGSEFKGGAIVLISLMGSIMISGLGSAASPAIQSQGKMWLGFLINFTHGIIILTVVYLFASSWGALSFAVGSIFAALAVTSWRYIYLRNDIPKTMLTRVFAASGIALLITVFCLMLPTEYRIILALPLTIGLLLTAFYFFILPRTRRSLIKILKMNHNM